VCSFETNQRKCVNCERFTKQNKLNAIRSFAHLRKVCIRFMTVVLPSVHPNRIIRLPLDGFKTKSIAENFYKTVEKIQIRLIPDTNNRCFTKRQTLFKTKSLFPKEYICKIRKGIFCSITSSRKFFSFKRLCEKIMAGTDTKHMII
jgi:hypothetical protein